MLYDPFFLLYINDCQLFLDIDHGSSCGSLPFVHISFWTTVVAVRIN